MTDPESEPAAPSPPAGPTTENRHDVFLSSAGYGLDTVRSELAVWLERRGYDAFVFEKFKDQAEWKKLLPAAREGICLEHVIRSRL